MGQDYIPRAESELNIWLENFKTNINVKGVEVGLTPAQITAIIAECNEIINTAVNAAIKRTALDEAMELRDITKTTNLQSIRNKISKIKTNDNYTTAIGESLGIIGTTLKLDVETFKPEIQAVLFAGFVRIKFTKKGIEGVNIYHRKKGEPIWKFLARDTKSPYDDHIELDTDGQPQHWEYRAFGVIDDAEIGQPSNIVSAIFGG